MPIDDIINEIDEYLARLRQARDLLAASPAATPRKSELRDKAVKVALKAKNATAVRPTRQRTPQEKPPSAIAPRHTKALVTGPDSASVIRRSAVPQIADPAPAAKQAIEPDMPSSIARRQRVRSTHRGTTRRAVSTKPPAITPAIARPAPMAPRIVVVSAEQAKRERDLAAARPEPRRQHIPSSGPSGRLAFEALFKDETQPSKPFQK